MMRAAAFAEGYSISDMALLLTGVSFSPSWSDSEWLEICVMTSECVVGGTTGSAGATILTIFGGMRKSERVPMRLCSLCGM